MSAKVQQENGEVCSSGDASLLPHLESLDRMLKLPVVDATWQQTQNVYGRVKVLFFGFPQDIVAGFLLEFLKELFLGFLLEFLQLVDQTVVKGIDRLEVSAPIIKEQPQEIYNPAKSKVLGTVKPYTEKVCELRQASQQKAASLKELSWKKANEVLATQYGSKAVNGVDTTAQAAERLLDYYFPKSAEDVEDDNAPIPVKEDPVLHTVQTVGRLSNKVARRVYRTVLNQIKCLRKEDVKDYVATLIAVLHLTSYLNFLNDKRQQQAVEDTPSAPVSASSSTASASSGSSSNASAVVATTKSSKTLQQTENGSDERTQ
ncbi:hypothetical protein RP20_CCG019698 [Aedes albopictus]|nr:hypothetical protein RP20_CCG019698 [Aedes albopictus]